MNEPAQNVRLSHPFTPFPEGTIGHDVKQCRLCSYSETFHQPEMNEPEQQEPLSCPFCGELPVITTATATPNSFKVRCNFCWARSGDHPAATAAIVAWNARADNSAALRDALERIEKLTTTNVTARKMQTQLFQIGRICSAALNQKGK